jgi:cystathionine beta-lyase family protein involved in aluminum resistance
MVSKVVSSKVDPRELIRHAELELKERFVEIEEISYQNQIKVLKAFRHNRLSEEHFGELFGCIFRPAISLAAC